MCSWQKIDLSEDCRENVFKKKDQNNINMYCDVLTLALKTAEKKAHEWLDLLYKAFDSLE